MSPALYSPPPRVSRGLHTILPWSVEAIGPQLTSGPAPASAIATVSNLVRYVPFCLASTFVAVEVGWMMGAAAGNGNAQVGVYDEAGTELVECTATTTSGATTARQTIDITDTTLPGGSSYYMAFRASSATDRFFCVIPAAGILEAAGVLQEAGQADLPATATFAVNATAWLPVFYVAGHTLL